jgi:hypothetical protein
MTAPLWVVFAALFGLVPLFALLVYCEEHPLSEQQKSAAGAIATLFSLLGLLVLITLICLRYP